MEPWCLCDENQWRFHNYDSSCRHDEMGEVHDELERVRILAGEYLTRAQVAESKLKGR